MPGPSFVTEDGDEGLFSMGCYGMGVSRLLAVVAEEHHDDRGLAWPPEVAPYQVHLARPRRRPFARGGRGRRPALRPTEPAAGVEVLYDDRDVSPGSSSPTPTCSACRSAWWWGQGPGPGGGRVAVPGHRGGARARRSDAAGSDDPVGLRPTAAEGRLGGRAGGSRRRRPDRGESHVTASTRRRPLLYF